MGEVTITFIWGLLVFIAVFLFNYFIVFGKEPNIKLSKTSTKKKVKKKKRKIEDFIGFSYLVPRFNLDTKKMDLRYVSIWISLINAFIIAFVFIAVYLIPFGYPFKMLIGFVLLFGLIYAIYELFGRVLVKKGWKK